MSNYFSTISEKKKPLFSLIRIYSIISFFDEIISTVFEIHEESSTVYSVFISESSVSKDVKCFFEKKKHTHTGKRWFYNLCVTSCELRIASCDFKKISLRVASSFLQAA